MLQSQDDEAIEASLLPPAVEEAGVIPAALLDLFQCQNPELTQLMIAAMLILPSSTANKLDCSDYASTTSEQSKHDIVEHIMKAMQDGEKVTGSTLRLVFRMITL
ncbi:hypothetical protein Gogos_021419 [Gossypium gossypioides]|uniref:Uncharacterized protein n=1 Tax=Gossypium gossypioides TaxID=34282 RepID=A0A7J9CXE5_GOSGO|nr:hypothetical protein [Gossypium gossypioides]